MTRRTRALSFIGGLAVVIALLYWIAPHEQVCEIAQNTGKENCTAHHMPYFLGWYVGTFLDAHNGAVSAIAGLIVAGFTLALWEATDKMQTITGRTLDHLRREFLANHRPKLILRRLTLDGKTGEPPPKPPRMRVELANVEGVGVIHASVQMAFGVFKTGYLIPWVIIQELEKSPVQTLEIPHAGSAAILVGFHGTPEDSFERPQILARTETVYCVGHVNYVDESGTNPYRFGFVRRWDVEHRWFERVDFPDFEYAD